MRLVFEKRKTTSISALILVPMVSFAVSLFLTALLLMIFEADPLKPIQQWQLVLLDLCMVLQRHL